MATTLWATTYIDNVLVKLYTSPNTKKHWAITDSPTGNEYRILLSLELFKNPRMLDEVLMHEFVHVVEYHVGAENLSHEVVGDCTTGAEMLGRYLSQLQRELKQVPRA